VQTISLTIEVKNIEAAKEALMKVDDKFDVRTRPLPAPTAIGKGLQGFIQFDPIRKNDLRNALQKIGDLVSWAASDDQQAGYAAAAEKFIALRDAAERRKQLLESAPATRGLISAETERLRILHEAYESARKTQSVTYIVNLAP
jgi:hypothetical protein